MNYYIYNDSRESDTVLYRVIALILVNIVPCWDIEGHELFNI